VALRTKCALSKQLATAVFKQILREPDGFVWRIFPGQEKSMPITFARSAGLALATAFLAVASYPALAQNSDYDWQKSYSVGDSPSLSIETGDSNLEIHSCGDCREVRIRIHSNRKLSEFLLEQHQDQNHVSFSLKEKRPYVRFSVNWHKASDSPQVSVETPASLGLDAKTEDGNLSVRGLAGNLQMHSGDGSVTLEDLRGDLHLTASDGNINIHNATGTLDAHASDGHMKVDGQFSAIHLHTSDGSLDLSLAAGSRLTAASRIESSDGRVTVRVPQNLAADLDVSTSDGHVNCALPLTLDNYNSGGGSHHHLTGHLNGGGVPLSIHTSDGNVNITAL
jgi:Putative adhesin